MEKCDKTADMFEDPGVEQPLTDKILELTKVIKQQANEIEHLKQQLGLKRCNT